MNARLDPIIERFRFSHHTLAIMFAMGMTVNEIAKRTGFTQRRLVILLDDPTFQELIEHYRTEARERMTQSLPDIMDYMAFNHTAALRQISEALEAADEEGAEPIPLPTLLKISGDMGDRTGYSKHTIKTVLSVDFATALDRAIERSGKGDQVKLIEGAVLPLQPKTVLPHKTETRPRAYRRA